MVWQGLLVIVAVSFFTTWLLRRYALARSIIDIPNARSSHTVPTPRGGGVAIVLSFLLVLPLLTATGLLTWANMWAMLGAGSVIAVLGFLDDHGHIAARWRLLGPFAASAWALYWLGGLPAISLIGIDFDLAWLGHGLAVFYLVWLLNLYNFMDGIDGFAGMTAVIGFFALAILGLLHGQISFLFLCSLLIAANAGFLYFNFPPAKIFMGDSGSTVMGFAMVAVSITGWKQGIYPFWIPLVIFSPFWVDATATLLARLYRHEKIWLPHRQHFYQRCVLAGYSHRQVTMTYGSIMLLCAASSVVWQFAGKGYNESALPVSWMVFYGLILFFSNHIIERKQRQSG